jgi:hypothetical protein
VENPAIRAFREACVEGSFALSPSRGKVVPERDVSFADFVAGPESIAKRTVIKLTDLRGSYLIITEYQHLQPGSIARTCVLDSRAVSKREAMAAYVQGLPESVVTPDWVPNMYQDIWTSDHPELGYKKQFRFRSDGSIVLEIGMYPPAAAQLKSGATKQ